MSTEEQPEVFDAIVVGSGFGGAVTACRLAEAGFSVCILERGRSYVKDDFPRVPAPDQFITHAEKADPSATPADFSRWLWRRDQGIYDIRNLGDAVSVQAAGYGGGSLIYANVHLRPPRDVFDDPWPQVYRENEFDSYFDLAAYVLRVSPIPKRLAKTLQLQRAARALNKGSDAHWFRPPLAVTFEEAAGTNQPFQNDFGREQQPCDMRGRCCLGCDRQAKNTLDKNYLARAERAGAYIQTLAEVTTIEKEETGFKVTYRDLLLRGGNEDAGDKGGPFVRGKYVFLCAGAVNTTELLMRNPRLLGASEELPDQSPVGSHYFPNMDSLAAIFDCDEPHEADYGPTITSAMLHRSDAEGSFSQSLDFLDGRSYGRTPVAAMHVRGTQSGATAELSHDPILDWGDWDGSAAGALVLSGDEGTFKPGEQLELFAEAMGRAAGQTEQVVVATATVRAPLVKHQHWFLAEDGGYPPEAEPLAGIFRSPLWLRRNRFIEPGDSQPRATPVPRRPPPRHLHFDAFTNALRTTSARAGATNGLLNRTFNVSLPVEADGGRPDLANKELSAFFPGWFITALQAEHRALLDQAATVALPMIGRLLDELSASVSKKIDADTVARFGLDFEANDPRKDVFIRGMLRQAVQVFGGSEADIAVQVATVLLEPVPTSPARLLNLLGDLLLRVLAYGQADGHTGVVLTMGRDLYRGRLYLRGDDRSGPKVLKARLPNALVDTASVLQERALRVIASQGWRGELRTNPAWAALGRRLTVHSQGGCPMGTERTLSVTTPLGEVHGCPGLYVMDAAAFPTSVGVNPSATILAVAEYKIDKFIEAQGSESASLLALERAKAVAWVNQQGRAELDPLNHRKMPANAPPALQVLGLTFKERMQGFFTPATPSVTLASLEQSPDDVAKFRDAETEGIGRGSEIEVELVATASDLARLISPERRVVPVEIALTGSVSIRPDRDSKEIGPFPVGPGSFLQMFVPPEDESPRVRFFRYKLLFDDHTKPWALRGLKVLRNDPGQDMWLDTSTLYFEMVSDSERHLGILRLSFPDFLQRQLPSMDILGTEDSVRKGWALAAFYKYFALEISKVYMERAGSLARLFSNAASIINA